MAYVRCPTPLLQFFPHSMSPMDDLDRLFRRLVQNVRNGYPDYLSRPFEVSELYQTLVPYRHNRRELEMETNQDYELALCRLLAGERGYVSGDGAMQLSIREEIEGPNPNTGIFRDYAASHVQLTAEGVRKIESAATGASAPRPTLATPPTPAPLRANPAPSAARAASSASREQPARARTSSESSARASAPRPAAASPPSTPSVASMIGVDPQSATSGCRYCGGALPGGRRVVFCPHCGQNLTVQRCPACGSELELGWKFCITCGRGVGSQ